MSELFRTKVKSVVNGKVVDIGDKLIYNADGEVKEIDWIKENLPKEKIECIVVKNALEVVDNLKSKGFLIRNSFGHLALTSSQVYHNTLGLGIYSTVFKSSGISIIPYNIDKCVSVFSARINTETTWINSADIYLVPNIQHPLYSQWVNDSLILSIFSDKSMQSSLRQVTYHSSLWDLENHFFYLSNSEMRELANQNNNITLYQDTFKYPNDRFVYNKLQSLQGQFSPDAQAVLDKGIELTRLSFTYRKDADPKFHLNSWDAGWYQIRMGILKEHFKTEYAEFRELLLALRKRMAPLVYELGFLKR